MFTTQKVMFSIKDFSCKCIIFNIYWKNPSWKTSFFVQWLSWKELVNIFRILIENFRMRLSNLVQIAQFFDRVHD